MISAATLGVGRPLFLSLLGISYRPATMLSISTLPSETEQRKYQIHAPLQGVFEDFLDDFLQ
jgi:hypothetical protein